MAKKKTAGPDSTTRTTPAASPKRRAATPKTDDAAASQASAKAEALDAGGSADLPDSAQLTTTLAGNGNGADPSSGSTRSPSYEEIAEAAYQRYLSRGGQHGRDFEDWVEAERELHSRK